MKTKIRLLCLLFVLILFGLTSVANAASTWVSQYRFSSNSALDMTRTADNGIVQVGYTTGGKTYIIKVDSLGSILWAKTLTNNIYFYPHSVFQAEDGGYVVFGDRSTTTNNSGLVFKVSDQGVLEWQKTIGLSGKNVSTRYAKKTKDGGYVISGTVSVNYSSSSLFVLRLDKDINVQWARQFSFAGTDGLMASSVVEAADGGFGFAAFARWPGNDDRAVIMKLDRQGLPEWQKTYDRGWAQYGNAEVPLALMATQDNGFLMVGYSRESYPYNEYTWLLKVNQNGEPVRANYIGMTPNGTSPLKVNETSDGAHLIPVYRPNRVAKLKDNGDFAWVKIASNVSVVVAAQELPDGGYAVSGNSGGDVLLARTDSQMKAAGDGAFCTLWGMNDSLGGSSFGFTVADLPITPTEPAFAMGEAGGVYSDLSLFKLDVCLVAAPDISVAPQSLAFGSVESGSAATASVTVTNKGTASLSVQSPVISGPDAPSFSSSGNCGALAPNKSCYLTITFRPTSLGPKNASLAILSNDPDSPTVTVPLSGAGVDTVPPVTTKMVSGVAGTGGWYTSDVSVLLTATDSASGVQDTSYSINGSATTVPGSSASFALVSEGTSTISYYARDNAGNIEQPHQFSVKTDKTAPGIIGRAVPAPNAYGWNNTDVAVDFTCSDAVSGIVNCTPRTALASEGAGQIALGTAIDAAGLSATARVSVNIDKTPPVITAVITSPAVQREWYNTDVTVTFFCSDALSGIASCPEPVTVSTEGAGQIVTGTAVDRAGNTASVPVTLNIDKTPPAAGISASPGLLWPPNHKMVDVALSGAVTDTGSGTASVVITVTDEYGVVQPAVNGLPAAISLEAWREGTDMDGRHYAITAVITDKAGNTTTVSTVVVCPHDRGN